MLARGWSEDGGNKGEKALFGEVRAEGRWRSLHAAHAHASTLGHVWWLLGVPVCSAAAASVCGTTPTQHHTTPYTHTASGPTQVRRNNACTRTQDFGARDPTTQEIETNFGEKSQGNFDTEHVIKWVIWKGGGEEGMCRGVQDTERLCQLPCQAEAAAASCSHARQKSSSSKLPPPPP